MSHLAVTDSTARYELNPGWGEMQSSLAATFTEAPWTLRRGLYVRFSDDQEALFSLFLGLGFCANRFELLHTHAHTRTANLEELSFCME